MPGAPSISSRGALPITKGCPISTLNLLILTVQERHHDELAQTASLRFSYCPDALGHPPLVLAGQYFRHCPGLGGTFHELGFADFHPALGAPHPGGIRNDLVFAIGGRQASAAAVRGTAAK